MYLPPPALLPPLLETSMADTREIKSVSVLLTL